MKKANSRYEKIIPNENITLSPRYKPLQISIFNNFNIFINRVLLRENVDLITHFEEEIWVLKEVV